jgi:hypothetical protein
MSNSNNGKHLKLWTPSTYHIEVEGYLDESWSDHLAGMRIKTRKRADQSTVTTLVGRIRDQSALAGLLNSLYEFHLPILSVQNIEEINGVCGEQQKADKSSPSGSEGRILPNDHVQGD